MYLFKVCFKVKTCFDDKLPNSRDFKHIDPLDNNLFIDNVISSIINLDDN